MWEYIRYIKKSQHIILSSLLFPKTNDHGDGSPVDFDQKNTHLIAQTPINHGQPQNRPPVGTPVSTSQTVYWLLYYQYKQIVRHSVSEEKVNENKSVW